MTDQELLHELEQLDAKALALLVVLQNRNVADSVMPTVIQLLQRETTRLKPAIGLLWQAIDYVPATDALHNKIGDYLIAYSDPSKEVATKEQQD